MTHDELRSVVLNHVPLAYQRALLAVVDENRRLRDLAPGPVTPLPPGPVTPLSDEQLEGLFPGYLAKEGRK